MERQELEQPTRALAYSSSTEGTQNVSQPGSSSNGAGAQEDDPPRKRRLLFPKARPKKLHEFLGRQSNASGDSDQASGVGAPCAPKPTDASSPPRPPMADDIGAVVCEGRSSDEILASAGIASKSQDTLAGEVGKQQPTARPQKLKCMTSGSKALDQATISTTISCQSPDSVSATMAVASGGSATSGDTRAMSLASPPLSAASSLLDSSCLGVQRLTLQSPSGNKANGSSENPTFASGKSPPEKRPSSGALERAEGDALHPAEELGDGGLGPLQKAEDFSGIPLAVRLQSRAVKQRVHGCDEVVMRLAGCKSCSEKVRLWDELVKPHFGGILKDTNALVGSKTVEMLLALVKDGGGADAASIPANAALPLLQQNGKLIVSHLLPNPRHFASCCEVMLTLSQASAECATEAVALIASVDQQLLDEKKGNVAAIKGQGLRVLGSTMELLLQMLQAFGLQLVIELGGVKGLIQPISCFASCSDKRVRTALCSLSATSIYLTRQAAGECAAATAKKTVLECLKGSKSMQTEVEQLLEKFVAEPPPASSRTIAGTEGQRSGIGQAQTAGETESRGTNVAAMLFEETDVIKAVCQQQADWVLRVTEGKQSVAHGEREGGEEPPWKVKLQAWQQLESALRDCACLYKKNPFLQQQLLPLMHRVLTSEPTLPVVTCALKAAQILTQLLLQPRSGEGSQQLQQHVRVLLPDVLAKLKVNNRPVQAAACACLGTFLCCLPIDVVVGDLLPIKEKLANYQKLLLDELTKAVQQQRGTPALHRAAASLFAAAKAAAEDGNATVRSTGVSLLAALARHAEGSAVVGEAMQTLPEQKRLQLQKALSSASTPNASDWPQSASSPRRSAVAPGKQGLGMPFSRMRSRCAAGSVPAASAPASAERQASVSAPGLTKTVRKQSSGAGGTANGKVLFHRSGGSAAATAVSAPPGAAPFSALGPWEVPPATIGTEEAEQRTRELFPPDLLQGLEATGGVERKRAYSALEAWSHHSCQCRLCERGAEELRMETDGNDKECRLEKFRQSAVHILLHLRTKFRGFRERTAVLEEACTSCLQSVIGGLLLPADVVKSTITGTKSTTGLCSPSGSQRNQTRRLPPVDRSIVGVVLEPLVDRLGDPRVGNEVLTIGLLLARCVETPITVAAQVALQAEGRVAGGRTMQGVCSLLEQLLQQWGLHAFGPPKQLLMIVRQMLEPNKGTRSVAFPLLKRLHAELGSRAISSMLVSYPLPDEIKNALKREEQQQSQQQHHHAHEGSGPPWSAAFAALTTGAAGAAAAVAGIACSEAHQLSGSSGLSVAEYITPELLQRLQYGQDESCLKSLHELMDVFVNKVVERVKPEGLSALVAALRKRLSDGNAAIRRQALIGLIVFRDRLVGSASTDVSGTFAARVYKQILPAVAEYLCDSDKKVLQASHLATAKWITAVGVTEALQLLQPILSCSNSAGTTACALPSQRAFAGAALRRAFSGGLSGACANNAKLRDALFNLIALTLPIKATREAAVQRILLPHLLDALQPQHRSEAAAPASLLLSLLMHEGCQHESVAEMLRQRLAGQVATPAPPPSAHSMISSLLVSEETMKLLFRARQDLSTVHTNLVVSSLQNVAQAEPLQQVTKDSYKGELFCAAPASTPESSAGVNCARANAALLSTRTQRLQRSSGTGFLTSRRHQFGLKDELYNELKGRLEPSLLLLMFPHSSGAPSPIGNRQGVPQLQQLKAAHEAWSELFSVDKGLKFPLHGEQSITDIMLKWTAYW